MYQRVSYWRFCALGVMCFLFTQVQISVASERPDFTGVWTMYVEPGQTANGFMLQQPDLPLTPEGKRRREEYNRLIGPGRDNPGAFCVTYGMPAMMESAGAYPIEFIQKPDQITIIYEVEGETRRVFLGDRIIPDEQRFPNRQGYSAGRWVGNTLVVETNSLTDGFDQLIHPHSEDAAIVETFNLETSKTGEKVIAYTMTMTDPIYYTKPVIVEKKWAYMQGESILPYNCPEQAWLNLLDLRRAQLNAGKPITATMKDVFADYE